MAFQFDLTTRNDWLTTLSTQLGASALIYIYTGSPPANCAATATGTRLVQRARFKPRGLWGRIYWFAVMPFHVFVFPGLVKGIVHDAQGPTRPAPSSL